MPRTFPWMWPSDDWRKSCASEGDLPTRTGAMACTTGGYHNLSAREHFCGWKFVAFQTVESPLCYWLLLSMSVLNLCQDCKIFLMTGHILHLDSMVITTRSFLPFLVEVIMI